MDKKNLKIGNKGGAKKVTKRLTEIRKAPLSEETLEILDRYNQKKKSNSARRSVGPHKDVGM